MSERRLTLREVIEMMVDITDEYPEMLESEVMVQDENGTQQVAYVNMVESCNGEVALIIEDVGND